MMCYVSRCITAVAVVVAVFGVNPCNAVEQYEVIGDGSTHDGSFSLAATYSVCLPPDDTMNLLAVHLRKEHEAARREQWEARFPQAGVLNYAGVINLQDDADWNVFLDVIKTFPADMADRLLAGFGPDRDPRIVCADSPYANPAHEDNQTELLTQWRATISGSNTELNSLGRVAIVGGGITGLTAAMSLSKYDGVEKVTVYEASDRFGGRVHTFYHPNEPKHHVELGAMRFKDDEGSAFLVAVNESLPSVRVVELFNSDAPTLSHIAGLTFNYTAPKDALEVTMKTIGFDYVRPHCVSAFSDVIGSVLKPYSEMMSKFKIDADVLGVLGDVTEFNLLQNAGMNEQEIDYVAITGNTAGYINRIGGSDFYADSGHFASQSSDDDETPLPFLTFEGGMEKLLEAIHDDAVSRNTRIHLNSPVTHIHHQTNGDIKVCTNHTTCDTFDHVIVTVPATVLTSIDFEPPLPRRKVQSCNNQEYDEATKIALFFTEPVQSLSKDWDIPWGTALTTDLPSRQIIFLDDHTVLVYVWGIHAERLAGMTVDLQIQQVLHDLATTLDVSIEAVRALYDGTHTHKSWKYDPNQRGAFALSFVRGYMSLWCGLTADDYGDNVYGRTSRVRFTGEHKYPTGHAWIDTGFKSLQRELNYLTTSPLK